MTPNLHAQEFANSIQNYSNPFNPETWIPYELADSGDVTIHIYDAQGMVVRTLALGYQSAGYYLSRGRAAHWDGRNQHGEQVASGVYTVKLSTPTFEATKRMLIHK